jgi:hypothetical protein
MLDKLNFLIEIAFTEYGNKCTYAIMFKGDSPAIYVNLGDTAIADFWYNNGEPERKCYVE